MYIEPNTNIKILKNVPLDKTYKHTLHFTSIEAQANYFKGMLKHNLTDQSYQRVNKGVARVSIKAEALYDCNYIMFQNTSFGNKWFYAFITSVEYVNNVVSEIKFEIDVMQTWYFDYELKECFVEREHSTSDNIGDNIVAEPVETGEYIVSNYDSLLYMSDMVVIVAVADTGDETIYGNLYDGIYGGVRLFAYQSNDVTNINAKLYEYIEAPNSVVSMYMCPRILVPNVPVGGKILSYGQGGVSNIVTCDAITGSEDFEGYTPKNKKLYTYPYNYFNIDNATGSTLPLRYEFFDDLKPVIRIEGTITQPVKCVARPCSYKGVSSYSDLGGYTSLNTESISLDSYPMCTWATDAYAAWSAQNSVPIVLNTLGSVVGLIGSLAGNKGGEKISASTSIFSNITSILSSTYKASISADICRGNTHNGNVNCANGRQQFYKSRVHVTKEFAEIIDNFFTMYGYATNRVKKPNTGGRPKWNYVKTGGCLAVGSVPADDMSKICGIYDNGITFWKNASEIGDYTLDNSPT